MFINGKLRVYEIDISGRKIEYLDCSIDFGDKIRARYFALLILMVDIVVPKG